MRERNRAVQRAARRMRDRQTGGAYTDARKLVRPGQRRSPIPRCPSMLEAGVWSRYGRWIFGTDDWQQWAVRTPCGRVQTPREAAAAGLVARPEQALTQCLLHGSAADPTVCPAVGSPGSAYYSVFWWHAKTPVLPFAFDEPYVVHGPLTEADDVDVVVPGITRPLAESSS
ncbi:hypothetical protein ACF09G_36145 [Streptomyces albogriseolus]|uniref:hypothetical protein n=1 Tax=Streptomyces albogriseolus TaxID=1887 RepID=UPI00198FCE8C|nr:hypothetical protein [Streptomyces sp.]